GVTKACAHLADLFVCRGPSSTAARDCSSRTRRLVEASMENAAPGFTRAAATATTAAPSTERRREHEKASRTGVSESGRSGCLRRPGSGRNRQRLGYERRSDADEPC